MVVVIDWSHDADEKLKPSPEVKKKMQPLTREGFGKLIKKALTNPSTKS